MHTLTETITRVCNRLNKNSADTTVTSRITKHINDSCQERWHGYAWSFRWREYPLVMTAMVSSGTLTATNASQTVTASGTPFVVGTHEGAWIRFLTDSPSAWYRILKVTSTSQVTIEPAYQGTSGSLKTYNLCKTDYVLPTELSDIGRVKITLDGRPLMIQHQVLTDGYLQPPTSVGYPSILSMFNQSATVTTYSTGTVTGSLNTTALTGSGTSWLTNIQPGDEITIASVIYTVQSVTSDTALTLYQNLTAAAAGASYSVSRTYGKVVRTNPTPDQPYVCFVKGLRRYQQLVNSADTNELLDKYFPAVIEDVCWREAASSPDPREDVMFQKAEFMWAKAQGEDESIISYDNTAPIWNARIY